MKNIWYKNLTMKHVRYPIFITSYYPKTPKGPSEDIPADSASQNPQWTEITIEDVTITDSSNSIILWGLPDQPITGFTLKNVKASCELGAFVFHANATFQGVEVIPKTGPALQVFNANVAGMNGVPFEGTFRSK